MEPCGTPETSPPLHRTLCYRLDRNALIHLNSSPLTPTWSNFRAVSDVWLSQKLLQNLKIQHAWVLVPHQGFQLTGGLLQIAGSDRSVLYESRAEMHWSCHYQKPDHLPMDETFQNLNYQACETHWTVISRMMVITLLEHLGNISPFPVLWKTAWYTSSRMMFITLLEHLGNISPCPVSWKTAWYTSSRMMFITLLEHLENISPCPVLWKTAWYTSFEEPTEGACNPRGTLPEEPTWYLVWSTCFAGINSSKLLTNLILSQRYFLYLHFTPGRHKLLFQFPHIICVLLSEHWLKVFPECLSFLLSRRYHSSRQV